MSEPFVMLPLRATPDEKAAAGYVRSWRSILDSPLWISAPHAWFRTWFYILHRANWKATRWWDRRQEIEVPAGSFITSIRKLSKETGNTLQQTRDALAYLRENTRINTVENTRWTLISVLDWHSYSGTVKDENTPKNNRQRIHHQERREEESESEADCAVTLVPTGAQNSNSLSQSDDDDDAESPTERLKRRLLRRHGDDHDWQATLAVIEGELENTDLRLVHFLELDRRVTRSPGRLQNPDGFYRSIARRLVEKREKKACCNGIGLRPDGSHCDCEFATVARRSVERALEVSRKAIERLRAKRLAAQNEQAS